MLYLHCFVATNISISKNKASYSQAEIQIDPTERESLTKKKNQSGLKLVDSGKLTAAIVGVVSRRLHNPAGNNERDEPPKPAAIPPDPGTGASELR